MTTASGSVRLLVTRDERPAEQRRDAHQREGVRRDLGAAHGLDTPILGHEVPAEYQRRAQLFDGPELGAPDREIVEGSAFGLAPGDIEMADGDDAVAPRDGQRRGQHLAEALEIEHCEGDRHCHGHCGHRRNPG